MAIILENKFGARSISKLYLNEELSDIKFVFQQNDTVEVLVAHKLILAAGSPVFKAMFFGLLKENEMVEIVDASVEEFKEFLQFFYLPKVTLSMENTEGVAHLADKYDMIDCLKMCGFSEDRLTNENLFWAYQLAMSMDNAELKGLCENRFRSLNPTEVFKSNTFLRCDRSVLRYILQSESMCCEEIDLFNACLAWAKASCRRNGSDENSSSNIKEQLGDCFHLIRFGNMESEELAAIMASDTNAGLFTRDELLDILRSKHTGQTKLGIFSHRPRSNGSVEWDSTKAIICTRKRTEDGSSYYIQNRESTWFSTTAWLLFGGINCTTVEEEYGDNGRLRFKIRIYEYNNQTFESNAATKLLFSGNYLTLTENNSTYFSIQPAIMVKPRKLYEIRLDATSDTDEDWYHTTTWKSEVKLDRDITIRFHPNPNENDSTRRGLVSHLYFRRA